MKYKKVFIVGSGRCGTHWVLNLFLNHPLVVGTLSESKAYMVFGAILHKKQNFEHFLRKISGRYWRSIIKYYESFPEGTRLQEYVTHAELSGYIREIKSTDISLENKAQQLIEKIFNNYYYKNGGDSNKLFVEKTPQHIYYVDKILDYYPEAKIIEIVRDGRDVCVSYQKLIEKGITWPPENRKEQVLLWKRAIRKGMELRSEKKYSPKILFVKYEDLLQNKAQNIRRMFDFAGLKYTEEDILRIVNSDKIINSSYKGNINGWKDVFTKQDICIFKKYANQELIESGYSW